MILLGNAPLSSISSSSRWRQSSKWWPVEVTLVKIQEKNLVWNTVESDGTRVIVYIFDKVHDGTSRLNIRLCQRQFNWIWERYRAPKAGELLSEEKSLQLYRNMPWSVNLSYMS